MLDAAQKFSNRITPLNDIILLDKSFDNEFGITKSDKLELVEAFRQSLIILPVAFFEDFLRTIIEQFVDDINSLQPRVEWTKLPLQLRRAHIYDTPVSISRKPPDGNDETYQAQCIEELRHVLTKITSPIDSPDRYIIAVESLVNTNSNPDSDTLKKMFRKIGIDNILQNQHLLIEMSSLSPAYNREESIRLKIDEIVNLRHGVAHGRPATNLARPDLEANLRFLDFLTNVLQNVADLKLQEIKSP